MFLHIGVKELGPQLLEADECARLIATHHLRVSDNVYCDDGRKSTLYAVGGHGASSQAKLRTSILRRAPSSVH